MQKADRSNKYEQKKIHQQKHKVQKQILNEDQNNFLKQVSQMSLQKLQVFLQNDYQKYTKKNQKLQFKLNNTISKRLIEFPDQVIQKQKDKIKKLFQKHNCKLKDEQINLLFVKSSNEMPKFNPGLQNFTWMITVEDDKLVVKFLFNSSQNNVNHVKIRVDLPLKIMPSAHKRLLKQAKQIIENLIQYKKQTQIIQKM